jgi:transcriptional regulator with XRE-family HTH domain
MKISKQIGDGAILQELGGRLAQARLEQNLTQAELATQAGVSKRTVERMETGGAAHLASFVRVCRALNLIERLEALVPESPPSPIAQLKLRSHERKRASSARVPAPAAPDANKWKWGDKP